MISDVTAPLIPLAGARTGLLLVLRRLPPRPSWRRAARQPGIAACLAALLALLWVGLAAALMTLLLAFFPGWPADRLRFAQDLIVGHVFPLVGLAVASAWSRMLLSGRWPRPADWIDRAGRVVGLNWLLIGLARTLRSYELLLRPRGMPDRAPPTWPGRRRRSVALPARPGSRAAPGRTPFAPPGRHPKNEPSLASACRGRATSPRPLVSTIGKEPTMDCPLCRVGLQMTERQGIEIDYCPKCRGVWLDRGELDKIIERSSAPYPAGGPPPRPAGDPGRDRPCGEKDRDRPHDSDYGRRKKKEGFWSELFDFD
jgi:Zn-finger nucleic acid-binding protein